MARIQFKEVSFKKRSLAVLDVANAIVKEYMAQGLRLTLRQLYYQFVSRDILPNTERSYKNLGNCISQGRLAGLLDWDAIEDRVRVPDSPPEFNSMQDLLDVAMRSYRLPRLLDQETYCELWVEKDALAGVLRPLSRKYHATLMVNRGYSSQSAMYESAGRISARTQEMGAQESVIFYLGDLDPSGEDMVRDIDERLEMFGVHVRVVKLALTIEQVREYNPPPNPTKLTDSRAGGFIAKYGMNSWEVDALPPQVLQEIIVAKFEDALDMDAMQEVIDREERDKAELKKALEKVQDNGS